MTEFYPSVMAETMIAQLTAEVERWRRHGVLVTEDCGSTASHPECRYLAVCLDGTMHCNKCGFTDTHARCDGSGKVLKDGAYRVPGMSLGTGQPAESVWFPASWLEGTPNEHSVD